MYNNLYFGPCSPISLYFVNCRHLLVPQKVVTRQIQSLHLPQLHCPIMLHLFYPSMHHQQSRLLPVERKVTPGITAGLFICKSLVCRNTARLVTGKSFECKRVPTVLSWFQSMSIGLHSNQDFFNYNLVHVKTPHWLYT